jgi:uncharacterized OB-fold protein
MAPRFLTEVEGGAALVGGYSPTSGRYHFPLGPACPYTGAEDVEEVPLSTEGRLWAWTTVTAPPPGYEGPVPYGFGIVELEREGLRVVGRLTEADPARLEAGQPMRVVADHLPGDVVTWAFAPAGSEDV